MEPGACGDGGSPARTTDADMDPLSIIASVFAIGSALGEISKLLRVIGDLRTADEQRGRVLQQLGIVQSSLGQLEKAQPPVEATDSNEDEKTKADTPQQSSTEEQLQLISLRSKELLRRLEWKLARMPDKPHNTLTRLRWIFKQRTLAREFREDLEATSSLLDLCVLPLKLQSFASVANMEPTVSTIAHQNQLIYDEFRKASNPPPTMTPLSCHGLPTRTVSQRDQEVEVSKGLSIWSRGPRFEFGYQRGHGKERYVILVRAKPFRSQPFVIVARLSVSRILVPLPRLSQLSIRNVVPESAPIFRACRSGDGQGVMDLLRSGRASLNDVTPSNDTPLAMAIKSGSAEVVSLLLRHGADVNMGCGQFETSPLQIATIFRQAHVVRILLRYNANMEYTSARNWSLLHHLFDRSQNGPDSTTDFFRIFQSKELVFD